MIRRFLEPSRGALLALVALSIAGCTKKLDFTGNSTGDSQAQKQPENQTPWAVNGGDIARFPDEVPLGPEAVVGRDKTPVRKAPGNGEVLTTLPSGTDVVKLSTHGSDDLVCFDDPADGTHKVGWISQSALGDPIPITPPPLPVPSTTATADADPPSTPPSPSPSPSGGHHHKHPHGPRQH